MKQTIAVQRILPFWRYLVRDDETPKGALVLHWISSVIMIAALPVTSDGYSFTIGLFTYGHILASRKQNHIFGQRFTGRKLTG